jgi:hypothetical protein
MTEREWLACADPVEMLEFLRDKASGRKLRLFACACCRRVWHIMNHKAGQDAVCVAEHFADGFSSQDEMQIAFNAAFAQAETMVNAWSSAQLDARQRLETQQELSRTETDAYWIDFRNYATTNLNASAYYAAAWSATIRFDPHGPSYDAADAAAGINSSPGDDYEDRAAFECERSVQSVILRDIIFNPFRHIAINPMWLTPTVTNFAQSAYDERIMPSGELDPARLAVLSDALEESGCDNAAILGHLRSPGPHVRGCWIIDLLLGKE